MFLYHLYSQFFKCSYLNTKKEKESIIFLQFRNSQRINYFLFVKQEITNNLLFWFINQPCVYLKVIFYNYQKVTKSFIHRQT